MTKNEVLDLFRVSRGTCHHSTATAAISAPNATDAASAATLAQAIRDAFATHLASVQTSGANGAHSAADTTTVQAGATANGSRQYAEALRACLDDHVRRADVHFAADNVNVLSAHTPRDGSNAETWRFLNAIKAAANAHFASALAAVPS